MASRAALLGFLLAMPLLTATSEGAAVKKHSGRIAEVGASAIALEEVVQWTGPGTGAVRRSFDLLPATTIEVVERSADVAPGGWPGSFRATSLALSDLRPGDYVTVAVEHRGRRAVARSVTAVRPAIR